MKAMSNLFIILGILLIIVGVLCKFTNLFHFLGKLPGDIRIEKENFSFYFPITTMILISVALSLILRFIKK